MEQQDFLKIIPAQYTGTVIEADSSTQLADETNAIHAFELAKQRLLDVNQWHKVSGLISAKFQVMSKDAKEVNRPVVKGDFLRVDIPGPGSSAGDGFDWVEVEELKEFSEGNVQSIGFRVRPVANPLGSPESIAHFYDVSATSNFIVTRVGNVIEAHIVDRNIKPNTETATIMDKIRDTAVGMSAIASFSKVQWQGLADGLVAIENN